MHQETAQTMALTALTYILSDDDLQARFLSLTGLSENEIRHRIEDSNFLAGILDFLVSHEPDLLAFAENANKKPEHIVSAWRKLGGGIGQEW
ncbi:MAG: DUF3572 domain-containing protein [Kordiimonadaceae bacterium]|nr:DUF3572 domain-containing protein [Kordiimonadaceae bacterium]